MMLVVMDDRLFLGEAGLSAIVVSMMFVIIDDRLLLGETCLSELISDFCTGGTL